MLNTPCFVYFYMLDFQNVTKYFQCRSIVYFYFQNNTKYFQCRSIVYFYFQNITKYFQCRSIVYFYLQNNTITRSTSSVGV